MEQQTKYDLAKTELLMTQEQISKYDQLSTSTKGWLVLLWAASLGWAFQSRRKEILLIGLLIVAVFWILDGFNKTYRQNYKKRRDEVATALRNFFRGEKMPPDFVSPQLPIQSTKDIFKNMFLPHILAPYLLFAVVTAIVFLRF